MSDSSENVKQAPAVVISPVSIPSVTVIGCGGAGINMVRNVVSHISGKAKHRFIDTSYSNIRPEEEIIVIQGDGSGLVRNKNVDPIMQKISSLSAEDLTLSDIVIVVFSMSGGSGSVLGPVLIREVSRRGKLAIAIVIASSQSEIHTTNTLNTLKTLESITSTNNIYLPITIFNNNSGMDLVDKNLPNKIERLIDLLTLPAAELDKNDRLHWINVPKTTNAPGGLRLLYVEGGQSQHGDKGPVLDDGELWPGLKDYIFDSVIHVRTATQRHRLSSFVKARVSYDGIFTTVQLVPMIGIIGNPPNAFEKMTTEIQDTLQQYKAQSFKKPAAVAVSSTDVDPDSGLVF